MTLVCTSRQGRVGSLSFLCLRVTSPSTATAECVLCGTKPVFAWRHCQRCYQRERRNPDTYRAWQRERIEERARRLVTPCDTPGCEGRATIRGRCRRCYDLLYKKFGRAFPDGPPVTVSAVEQWRRTLAGWDRCVRKGVTIPDSTPAP
jgi:hypothetical protein